MSNSSDDICLCCILTTVVNPLPATSFGDQYELAGYLQISLDAILILIQCLFIRGASPRCGWKSEFSFTLLVGLAFNGIQAYISDILGIFASMLAYQGILDWKKGQRIFRIIGSFNFVPQLTILLTNFCITFHRCCYVLFPYEAPHYFGPLLSKILLAFLLSIHLFLSTFWSMDYMGLRYHPGYYMSSIRGGLPYTCAMLAISDQSNLLMPTNMVFYSFLVVYILFSKKIAIRGNDEIRFTLQAFLSMVLELGLFLFYYFIQMKNDDPWYKQSINTWSQLIFAASPSIIYLIFNTEVRQRALKRSPVQFGQVLSFQSNH